VFLQPEWAENLNSVLDDNKLLTLPSGERLPIPNNVRIILEVDSLAHATPATVSPCGMVWFSDDCITAEMALEHLLGTLAKQDLVGEGLAEGEVPAAQTLFLNTIKPFVTSARTTSLVIDALDFALKESYIMETSRVQLLLNLCALMVQGFTLAIEYDENHPDFPMSGDHMEKFAKRWMLHSLLWGFCRSALWEVRRRFSEMLIRPSGFILPDNDGNIFDYGVRVESGQYDPWSDSVPRMEIESHRVAASDVVITTTDTVRHSDVLAGWLDRRMPLILCGPPGSGKQVCVVDCASDLVPNHFFFFLLQVKP